MLHGRSYQYRFAFLGFAATAILFGLILLLTGWHLYVVWLISINLTTFALFGIDKGLSKTDQVRIPEGVLHLFTILGGALGQWLGRTIFHHKTNFERHPAFRIVLIASLLLQGVLIYLLFIYR